ncbi:MAG: molybdate ABC transporter substrate-binding protein [Chloroflexota bacterium]
MHTSLLVTFFAILALPLTSCGGAPAPSPAATVNPAISAAASPTAATVPVSSGQPKKLTVFAASSLTESFTELATGFSAKAEGAKVTYNFGGSNQLRTQIEQGAAADVFASANEKEMDTLVKAGLIEGVPSIFAKNRLVVITPKGNPGKVEKLQDLGREGLKIVVAGPNVPVGNYMLQMLDKMNADPTYGSGFKEKFMKNVISEETNVKQVVAKVQLGEGDAGVVYGTDVTAKVAPEVQMIEVPDAFNVTAQYPIAPTKDAKEKELAQAFVQFLLSDEGQQVMKRYNFAPAH